MKSTEYLSYYATRFKTVEIDSTYYGTPAESTVRSWYRKTPPDFIFAAKVPQVVNFRTSSLADLAMRGSAISLLMWASVELLSFFLFDMS